MPTSLAYYTHSLASSADVVSLALLAFAPISKAVVVPYGPAAVYCVKIALKRIPAYVSV
jgi:hypothetical protein